jgi:hypothetical protein
VSATKSTTGTPRRKGDRLIKFETGVVAGATEIGGFIPGETGLRLTQIISPKNVRRRRRCPAYLLKTRDYLCPTYSEATRPITVASVPIPENALSIRQNGQCSGDLRDGRQRSSASQGRHGATITPPPPGSMELVSYDFPVLHVATSSQAKSIYEQ